MVTVPSLRVTQLSKSFGEVVANEQVSLDAWPGEVHCLLGENGAGKSTLIAMLAGLQRPDSGQLEVDGRAVVLSSPAVSRAHGIGVVFQHSSLIGTMTVAENLMLNRVDPQAGFWLSAAQVRDYLAEIEELFGTVLLPDTMVNELSLGEQQQLDIGQAFLAHPRVLVLDEPTSMLGSDSVDRLMQSIRALTDRGVAVILVTHKIDEALQISDRVTVLRAGTVARHFDTRQASNHAPLKSQILAAMFGDDGARKAPSRVRARAVPEPGPGPELLRLSEVSTAGPGRPLRQLSLSVRAGEILGVAGIDGQGQRALAEAIAGQIRPTAGSVCVSGQTVNGLSVRKRQALGVRYVTDDRLHEGIIGSFSVGLNLLLTRIGQRPFWRRGRLNRAAAASHSQQLIEQFGIAPPDATLRAGTLSGGNIQKILLARALDAEARIVVFHKPSYGLDLHTVSLVRAEISRIAAAGAAVLLLSTELEELLELADRIAVISNGHIVGEIENVQTSVEAESGVRSRIGDLISGGDPR